MTCFLFPVPRKAVFNEKKFDYSAAQWLKISPELSCELKRAALEFSANIKDIFPCPLRLTAGQPQNGKVLLDMELDCAAGRRPQQYNIVSSADGIKLSATDEAGLYFGLKTIEQLVSQTGVFFPECKIEDYPDFEHRGFMLDVSRCKVPLMHELYEFVDMLSTLKYNQLQLYIEHTFEFSGAETVWSDASPFTSEEIMQLDMYCRERFIELVPNLNSFGHLERWLKHDEFRHLAECPDGFTLPDGRKKDCGGVLKPDQESLEFLNGLYSEYLPNFSSVKFNIGCDETWELGEGVSKTLCEEKGKTQVYMDFLLKIAELAAVHGREAMFWGDIILHQPELINKLPKGITALNWGYEDDHPFATETKAFAEAGVPFYVCPGTSSWNSLAGRTDNSMKNLLDAAEYGSENSAIGYLITDWGDGGHHQYSPLSWPGICAGAAFSWCHEVNKHADIAEAVDLLIARDCGGVIGDYLMSYGNLYTLFEHKIKNGTLFYRALVAPLDSKPDWLDKYSVAEVHKALHALCELRGHLATALPETDDGRLMIEELLNSSFMTECALNKMLLFKGEEIDVKALKKLLRHVIGKHEELWLKRNRAGGLNESSAHLRKVLEGLPRG